MKISTHVDWDQVRTNLADQEFPLAVIDGIFLADSLISLASELHTQAGWRQPDWGADWFDLSSGYENIINPSLPDLTEFCTNIIEFVGLPASSRLKGVFAVRCNGNAGLLPHADNADFVLNIWTTPDRFNQNIGSGGMTVWNVKSPPEASPEQFTNADWVQKYIKDSGDVRKLHIPYRCNRAIFFDARLFHESQPISFIGNDKLSMRTNLSFAFKHD
ncbi:MAG: hypothetical protein GQ535_03770 [Rhodobacteraceae bacterium]|nr:hypothetical protein [Paracoccaceae bacterium]